MSVGILHENLLYFLLPDYYELHASHVAPGISRVLGL